jgi:adenosylhomocysteinase
VSGPVLTPCRSCSDHAVADLSLAAWGRKEITIAESEMPALMAIRREYAASQPLKGARITGSLHMTIQTAVLVETLQALGAEVRWASCNIFSTQDHAAAALVAVGTPVFAYKGETLKDYWDYTHRIFEFGPKGSAAEGPNMILDDGGDATLLMHLGKKAEKDASVSPTRAARKSASSSPPSRPSWPWTPLVQPQERADHRRDRRDDHRRAPPEGDVGQGHADVPRHQRQRLGHQEQVRQPLRLPREPGRRHQARHRRDGGRQDRRGRRLRRRGQGQRAGAARAEAQVWVTEIDPINALQAAMEGFRVVTMDWAADKADIFVTATGNKRVITREHMAAMKHNAIVCNIGHFDNEIDIAALEDLPGKRSSRRSTTSSSPTASASSCWPRAGW